MPNRLTSLNREVTDRETYLVSINKQIEEATILGSEALRDIQLEIDQLEKEKARLAKQLISIRQDIRLAIEYKKREEPL